MEKLLEWCIHLVQSFRDLVAKLELTDETREKLVTEIDRLERTSPQQTEYGWIRTWLETVTELPWGERTDDHLDLAAARQVLDADQQVVRTLGAGSGMIAAIRYEGGQPTWIVTATDAAGLKAAADALQEGDLGGHFALAVSNGQAVALPSP